MKRSIILPILALLISGIMTDFAQAQSNKTFHLKVKPDNNVWRVINTDTTPPSPLVRVTAGEIVTWSSESDLVFQFPKEISSYFEPVSSNDSLEPGHLKNLPAGQELKLRVKKVDKKGNDKRVIQYAVFVRMAGTFAQGESPPTIIVY